MFDENLGIYLVIAIMAMSICMAIIPLMMKYASVIGMVDQPDPRKVHVAPVPRVGGVGIVLGALTPLLIWLPFDPLYLSLLLGSFVLLVFGVWDDAKELGHYVKFIGQFVAAILVVYYGDLYVAHFPLMGLSVLHESVGRPFTVIAIVGMINAINHSDGLDGLAGGESLMSLLAIAYLAYIYDGTELLIIAIAAAGGIFGFLRFNSHPARVFMGDGGSQFIGFIVACLVILLTQKVNTALSPAVPILLLGLPIIDILAVFFLRARHGLNLFKATRNHIHHRLLDIGFYHYESVVIIYSIQLFFVVCGILLPYESDVLILSIYLVVCSIVFASITIAENKNWKVHVSDRDTATNYLSRMLREYGLASIPTRILESGIPLFIIASSLMSSDVPIDIGISSLILAIALVVSTFTNWLNLSVYRLVLFVSIGFSVYLLMIHPAEWLHSEAILAYIYFTVMVLATFAAARISLSDRFQITPLDYLVVIVTLVISIAPNGGFTDTGIIWMLAQIIVLFYACELVIQSKIIHVNRFNGAIILALSTIAFRGLI